MTEEERLEQLEKFKKANRHTIMSIITFLAALASSFLLFVGCFSTSPEKMAKMPTDSFIVIALAVIATLLYFGGWVFTFLGRRYNNMTLLIVIGILLSLFIVPLYFTGLVYCRDMLSYMY